MQLVHVGGIVVYYDTLWHVAARIFGSSLRSGWHHLYLSSSSAACLRVPCRPADRVLEHSYYPQMRDFNRQLANDPRVLASLVPLSYGITVAIKSIDLDGPALAAARAASAGGEGDEQIRELMRQRREAAVAELAAMK